MDKITCSKKEFLTMQLAQDGAQKINSKKPSKNGRPVKLRPYKCDKCPFYHITSMEAKSYKWKTNLEYRNNVREKHFIQTESRHWNKIFGIEE